MRFLLIQLQRSLPLHRRPAPLHGSLFGVSRAGRDASRRTTTRHGTVTYLFREGNDYGTRLWEKDRASM